jgi:hypothetical protein
LLAEQDDTAVADCRDHDFDDYAASPVKLNAPAALCTAISAPATMSVQAWPATHVGIAIGQNGMNMILSRTPPPRPRRRRDR